MHPNFKNFLQENLNHTKLRFEKSKKVLILRLFSSVYLANKPKVWKNDLLRSSSPLNLTTLSSLEVFLYLRLKEILGTNDLAFSSVEAIFGNLQAMYEMVMNHKCIPVGVSIPEKSQVFSITFVNARTTDTQLAKKLE